MAGIENAALAGAAWATTLAAVLMVIVAITRRGTGGGFLPVLALLLAVLLLALVIAAAVGVPWTALGVMGVVAATVGAALVLTGRLPGATAAYAVLVIVGIVAAWGAATGRLAFPAPR
ncbi:hypothetical protein MHY85_05670 [Cellulomonas sp. ACRRI]|uniref:hypothetical protein n=1 Tax=Cellulomonas sp. ACRRI TaxID=2918188 RepID=UPI001EF2CBFE|nr:hypothetical protein [Cellulomonas sp. ACRRI]MCG7285464.1 hypothetical protein [Cellulomonas sp. ACRRI]